MHFHGLLLIQIGGGGRACYLHGSMPDNKPAAENIPQTHVAAQNAPPGKMNRVMCAVLALLLMLTCVPAWAKWVLIQESSDKWLYIDPSTIRKAGQYRRVWALINFRKQAPLGVYSARTHQQYDCKRGRFRILKRDSFSEWMADGRNVASLARPEKWDYIAPGTVAQAIFRKVCAK
jgi:hypothetical protein